MGRGNAWEAATVSGLDRLGMCNDPEDKSKKYNKKESRMATFHLSFSLWIVFFRFQASKRNITKQVKEHKSYALLFAIT
jgi:hypothetical protein